FQAYLALERNRPGCETDLPATASLASGTLTFRKWLSGLRRGLASTGGLASGTLTLREVVVWIANRRKTVCPFNDGNSLSLFGPVLARRWQGETSRSL
ncbi:MAG: hypothetical protein JSU96_01355, partial [Acidobacteriota bacterium]